MGRRETVIEVSCYAGHRFPERPLSFKLLERTFQVREVLDRWYGEHDITFKVRADDRRIYLLKYQEALDQWTLAGMAFAPVPSQESGRDVWKSGFSRPGKAKEDLLF
jgi:hypothetical protein